MMKLKTPHIIALKTVIHLASLLPVLYMLWLAANDHLGADPVKALIHFTGISALNLLLITLCVSPLAKWLKQGMLMRVRRLLGIYCWGYALLHLLCYLVFGLQWDFSIFGEDIIKRPYITVGITTLLILTVLAITSLNRLRSALGKRWQQLHNFIYLATIMAGIHYIWSVKSDLRQPLFYLLIISVLLALRWSKLKRTLGQGR